MKTGIVGGVIGVVIGLVIGVFVWPSIRSGEKGTGVAAVAKSAEAVVDELFCGEAKDGELVEIKMSGESLGSFRLSPKQKELAAKGNVLSQYYTTGVLSDEMVVLKKNNPWLLVNSERAEIELKYQKMVASLLESRKKAAANK